MKIGSISYVNSLPVDLGLSSACVALAGAEIVSGVPSELSRKISASEIDLGPVSTFWYAGRSDEFYLLPDLSISSESGVQSVLLFSRQPVSMLAGKKIALTTQGKTTPALLEVLCRSFYGFSPEFIPLKADADFLAPDFDAALVIGNDALLARQKYANSSLHVLDLAEEWKKRTGLPFVFAVWVVRREYFQFHETEVRQAVAAILESKRWGLSHPAEVLQKARAMTGLSDEILKSYFSCLSYDFGDQTQKGMRLFFDESRRLGLLKNAPEITFIPGPRQTSPTPVLAAKL